MRLVATNKRRPKKRTVSRSFRLPPDIDRALGAEARRRQWSKSFLIRDILVAHVTYQRTMITHETAPQGKAES